MARYLQRYVGQYRVIAEYDKTTNDFPRITEGCNKGMLDPSFDDLFIPCRAKGKIYHVGGSNLQYYCPSLGRGHNIIKNIYLEQIGSIDKHITINIYKDKDGEDKENKTYNYEAIYNELIENGLIHDIEDTDSEVLFKFKAKNIDTIAKYVEPKTFGASISPFSKRNLRREKYNIPSEDLAQYKKITAIIPKGGMRVYVDMNNAFLDSLVGRKHKNNNIKEDMQRSGLKVREYIHKINKWNEYITFIKNYLDGVYGGLKYNEENCTV